MDKTQNNLCLILRDNLPGACKQGIEAMSPEEWAYIHGIASTNNLLPLLFFKLKSHKLSVPSPMEATLRNAYLRFAGSDLTRRRQLLEVIRIFNDNGIDHVLLKGSHLAEKVYSNSALRPMCDMDVLIKKHEFEKAYDALRGNGYVSSNLELHDFDLYSPNGHYPPLVKAGCLPIELHWNINKRFNVENIDGIWARAESVAVGGLKTKVLSPEDLLLHLAVHKGADLFASSFLVFNDIKEVVSRHEINWGRLFSLASAKGEWDNAKCLFLALHLSGKLLEVAIPGEDSLKKIQPADFSENHEALLMDQVFARFSADRLTYAAARALTRVGLKVNPLLMFKYLMTPRRICLRYGKKYSWGILPYLYCKRITEKTGDIFTVLAGLMKNNKDMRALCAVSKTSSKLEDWLKT